MDLKKIVGLIIFLFTSLLVNSQTDKTIGELLNVKEGCPIPMATKSNTPIRKPQYAQVEVPSFSESPSSVPQKKVVPPTTEEWTKTLQDFIKKQNLEFPTKNFGENKFVQDDNYLWGLWSAEGKELVKPSFEFVKKARKGLYFFGKKAAEKGMNVYDEKGRALLKKNYPFMIPNIINNSVVVGVGKYQGVVSLKGKILIKPKYDRVDYNGGPWILHKDDLMGVANEKGKIIIPVKHKIIKKATTNDESIFFFAQEENGELTIYKKGKAILKTGIKFYKHADGRIFNQRYLFYNNRLIDLKKKKFLLCDEKMKIEKHHQSFNLFAITKDKKTFVFNEKGQLIFDLPYANKFYSLSFLNGLAPIALLIGEKNPIGFSKAKYGILNEDLEWELKPDYDYMKMVKDTNIYIVTNEKKYGVIDSKGKTIIPFEYRFITPIGDRLIAYLKKGSTEFKLFDHSGKLLLQTLMPVTGLRTSSTGYEGKRLTDNKRVILNDKFKIIYDKGFNNCGQFGEEAIWIDRFGKPRVYEIFDYEGSPYPIMVEGKLRTDIKKIGRLYHTPFFYVELSDDKNYLVNTKLKEAYLINDEINYMSEDLYKTFGLLSTGRDYQKDMGLVDLLGNEILPPTLREVRGSGNYIRISTKERSHMFNKRGEELLKEYDSVYHLEDEYFSVRKDGLIGVATASGRVVIPLKFKYVQDDHYPFLFKATTLEGKKILFDLDGEKIRDL